MTRTNDEIERILAENYHKYCERCLDGNPMRLRRVTDEIWCREHYELWLTEGDDLDDHTHARDARHMTTLDMNECRNSSVMSGGKT